MPAATLDAAGLADLFNRCYAGYFTPVALSAEALSAMNAAHDVDLDRSLVARLDGVPSGLVLLAVRGDRGWIGGMGVVPEARGRRLGRELMSAALDSAWSSGLSSVQLEVIEENAWAIAVYDQAGFLDRRRLEVWARAPGEAGPAGPLPASRRIDVERWIATLGGGTRADRPWQREVLPGAATIEAFAVEENGVPVAGLALRRDGPRAVILDLGASAAAPEGALEASLRNAIATHADAAFTLLNLPEGDPARPALSALGFEVRFRQREMIVRRP